MIASDGLPPSYSRRVVATTTYATLISIWPIMFGGIVGYDMLLRLPLLWLGFFWPIALLSINICHCTQARDKPRTERSNMQMDINAVTGFCFAVGSMISSQLGKKALLTVSNIFTTAFLLCLAFVLPTPDIPRQSSLAVVVDVVQGTFLQCAIALLISGIVINLRIGSRYAEMRGDVVDKLIATPVRKLMRGARGA